MTLDAVGSVVVGVLSDTHIPYRMKQLPPRVLDAFEGVDVILHAGDVDKPWALAPLRRIAPVYAVRGNFHVLDLSSGGASLPAVVELQLAGHRVVLSHGYVPGLAALWLKGRDLALRLLGASDKARFNERIGRRLSALHAGADVIVFGHTHRAYVGWVGDTLLVNPGAVCPTLSEQPTVARMRLDEGRPQVEIVPLCAVSGASGNGPE